MSKIISIDLTLDELAALSAMARNGWDALGQEERDEVVGPTHVPAAITAVALIRRTLRERTAPKLPK